MSPHAGLAAILLGGGLVWSGCRSVAVDPATPVRDRLEIRSVTFLPAQSREFVIFVVKVDYALASSAEGNVALASELDPGDSTTLIQQRVARGTGALELLAE